MATHPFIHWCKRYLSFTLLCVVGAIIFVLFFNGNSVRTSYYHEQQIEQLRQRIKDSRDTLNHYRQLNSSLRTDPQTMERIVREQYHMQRPNEDIYIFQ